LSARFAEGVGNSPEVCSSVTVHAPPFASDERTVGRPRDDEDTEPLVRGTSIGCEYRTPLRIEPEPGKIEENTSERSNIRPVRDS